MAEYKLGEIETIFADIIWNNEPITTRKLTEMAEGVRKDLRRSLQNESGQYDQQDDHAACHTHI